MHGLVTREDPRRRRGDLELKLENPLGFFESERLVEINDHLLQAMGCQWDRPPLLPSRWDKPPLFEAVQLHRSKLDFYALQDSWVDKDPRLCITYPAYLHILLRRIPLVVALRKPLAVATSLHARNGFSLNQGLVLWWIYNYHIASQLCSKDLLVPYCDLLSLDDQLLVNFFGPFLELHRHQRPSDDESRDLISSLLRKNLNRSDSALSAVSRSLIHPTLLKVCEESYRSVVQSSDQVASFQEQFSFLPRAVLECSVQDQLLPEVEASSVKNRLVLIELEMSNLRSSLEEKEMSCSSLEYQLRALQNSHCWRLTAPFRSIFNFIKRAFRWLLNSVQSR